MLGPAQVAAHAGGLARLGFASDAELAAAIRPSAGVPIPADWVGLGRGGGQGPGGQPRLRLTAGDTGPRLLARPAAAPTAGHVPRSRPFRTCPRCSRRSCDLARPSERDNARQLRKGPRRGPQGVRTRLEATPSVTVRRPRPIVRLRWPPMRERSGAIGRELGHGRAPGPVADQLFEPPLVGRRVDEHGCGVGERGRAGGHLDQPADIRSRPAPSRTATAPIRPAPVCLPARDGRRLACWRSPEMAGQR